MTHHTLIGFCHWDIPAAIILLLVLAILLYRNHKLKKRKEELQEKLDDYTANSELVNAAAADAVPIPDEMTYTKVDASDKE
ncbi:MAG: hypothetical protein KBS63_04450 [Clostridiales bacterium]|nr:hypothetical protein [Candidatus Crickella caballi]